MYTATEFGRSVLRVPSLECLERCLVAALSQLDLHLVAPAEETSRLPSSGTEYYHMD